MPAEYFISLLLVILAVLVARRTGRSAVQNFVFFALSLVAVVLLVAYPAANYFTGQGINSAAVFHLRYGLEGAGFREYSALIGWTAAALIVLPAIIAVLCFRKTNRIREPRFVGLAFGILIASFTANPATWNIVELLKPIPPATADFQRHYRTPRLSVVSDDHPNFVFIFAESLERTYFDEAIFPGLINELRDLERQSQSFTDIHTLEGTGFTMGGIVASLCGLPLYSPANANSMSGMDVFLPGAIGLTNLLHKHAGYHLAFMGGANLLFAGKAKFLKTHEFDEAAGFSELHGRLPDKTYINNWGLYDDTLLDLAFDRFVELSREQKRFGLFLLTLDTHHPNGHVSRSVSNVRYRDGKNPMLNAVAASDRLLAAFVRRIQQSAFGHNTVIVIASDHLAMNNAASDLLLKGRRRNLFMVLDPRRSTGAQIGRTGSTLDTGTTLLPFLGFKGVIGLGRDLRDAATSDEEIAYIHRKETVLSWRGELMRFWQFPEFKDTLSFNEQTAEITLDGRRFGAPVLIELDSDHQTKLRFETDALWDVRLTEQTEKLTPDSPYALVVKREDAKAVVSPDQRDIDSAWVLVVGRAGGRKIARPLSSESSLSRRELDELLSKLEGR